MYINLTRRTADLASELCYTMFNNTPRNIHREDSYVTRKFMCKTTLDINEKKPENRACTKQKDKTDAFRAK